MKMKSVSKLWLGKIWVLPQFYILAGVFGKKRHQTVKRSGLEPFKVDLCLFGGRSARPVDPQRLGTSLGGSGRPDGWRETSTKVVEGVEGVGTVVAPTRSERYRACYEGNGVETGRYPP